MRLRKASIAKCCDCICDRLEAGTAAQQIACCVDADCPLRPVRPITATVIAMRLLDCYHTTPTQLNSKAGALVGLSPPVKMPYQPELPGLEEWLPELAAVEYLGSDTSTLRDLRSGHWKGFTLFRECGGEHYYRRTDLDDWLANNAQRNAGKTSGKF